MRIVDLNAEDSSLIEQLALLLVEEFRDTAPEAWPDLAAGLEEVREALEEGRICRVALDEAGMAMGWIGGISSYGGHTWELHPLVVSIAYQGRGVGRALVEDLEQQVLARGGTSLYLGTDDEDGRTSLAGVDLYPNVLEHLARIEDRRGHPFAFYRRVGFTVVGTIPDANGFGKPDILMAKRIVRREDGDV